MVQASGPSPAVIAGVIWADPAWTAFRAVYTDPRGVNLTNLDVAVSTRSTLTDAQVWAYVTRVLTNPAAESVLNNMRVGQYRGARTAANTGALNLNAGAGTSGEVGADVVTIGTAGVINIIQSLIVRIGGCTAAAVVTVKLFKDVNGTERKVYTQNFTVGTDEDSPWIISGQLFGYGQVRCEMYSNNVADVAIVVAYEFVTG